MGKIILISYSIISLIVITTCQEPFRSNTLNFRQVFYEKLVLHIHNLYIHPNNNKSLLDVIIIVRSQGGSYHFERFKRFEKELKLQLTAELISDDLLSIGVLPIHEIEKEINGAWTVFPVIRRLLSQISYTKWILICEDSTRLNLTKINYFLKQQTKLNKLVYWGRCLQDDSLSIIHHFADTKLKYPLLHAGTIISFSLVQELVEFLEERQSDSFTIDVQFELAKFIKDHLNISLDCLQDSLCIDKSNQQCMTWVDVKGVNSGCDIINSSMIDIAVKTYSEYYKSRLPALLETWVPLVDNIKFYTNSLYGTEHLAIPQDRFVVIDTPNTKIGHCGKLRYILKDFAGDKNRREWLLIADDDTFIIPDRLYSILSCYNPQDHILLGDKYGFMQRSMLGYPYITGGGGMVMSRVAVEAIVTSGVQCWANNSPDDMWLGSTAQMLGSIHIVHHYGFHQSTPDSYTWEYLSCTSNVSFHKWSYNSAIEQYKFYLKT